MHTPCFVAILLSLAIPAKAQDIAPAVELDRIVVSARKADEPVEKVPGSISAWSSQDLADEQPIDIASLESHGMVMQSASGIGSVFVRGMGGGGRNTGFDPRVPVYIDGIYAGGSTVLLAPLSSFKSVQILRGSQGPLFGRNAMAGAVLVESRRADGGGLLRLADDSAGGSVAGFGGWEGERWALGGSAGHLQRWTREASSAGLAGHGKLGGGQVRIGLDHARIDDSSGLGQARSGFFGVPLAAQQQGDSSFNARVGGGSVRWSRDIGSGSLELVSGHRNSYLQRLSDPDHSLRDMVHADYQDWFSNSSFEARWRQPIGRASLMAGAYMAHEKTRTIRRVDIGDDSGAPVFVPGLGSVPFSALFRVSPGLGALSNATVSTDVSALFGALDIPANDRVSVQVSGRIEDERRQASFDLDGSRSGRLGLASVDGFVDQREGVSFSPTVGATWKTDDRMAFAKASRAYKSGGWNLDFLNPAQVQAGLDFERERMDTVEVGFKFAKPAMDWEVVAFHSVAHDYQVFQSRAISGGGSVMVLGNAARARSIGVEGQARWKGANGWQVEAGGAWNKAEFLSFPGGGPAGQDLSGNAMPLAPEWSGHIELSREWDAAGAHWRAQSDVQAYSERYSGPENIQSQRLEAGSTWNARIERSSLDGQVMVSGVVRNILDDKGDTHHVRDFFGHDVYSQNEGRSVGIEATYRW